MEKYTISAEGRSIEIEAESDGTLRLNGTPMPLEMASSNRVFKVLSGGAVHTLYIRRLEDHTCEVWIKHHVFKLKIEDNRTRLLRSLETKGGMVHAAVDVRAPMPGLVLEVAVAEGEKVAAGGKLFILEAMKMENEIRAPMGGTVEGVKVRKGDVVEKDQLLVRIQNE